MNYMGTSADHVRHAMSYAAELSVERDGAKSNDIADRLISVQGVCERSVITHLGAAIIEELRELRMAVAPTRSDATPDEEPGEHIHGSGGIVDSVDGLVWARQFIKKFQISMTSVATRRLLDDKDIERLMCAWLGDALQTGIAYGRKQAIKDMREAVSELDPQS